MNFKALGGTRLLSDTVIYGISNVIQKSFAFLLFFLFPKILQLKIMVLLILF